MSIWHLIGIMSGTSADGVDCVIIRVDKEHIELLAHHAEPFPDPLRQDILRLNAPHEDEINKMGRCARQLGHVYADAAMRLLKQNKIAPEKIDLIACHGQTIRHQPQGEHGFTLQIGWADIIAETSGISTVSDFRPRDIAAGGQGAPLVPPFHHALFASKHPRIILNIGGMANLSWLPPKGDSRPLIAFDTGPGNVLMDALARRLSAGAEHYDRQGMLAAQGRVNHQRLREWLALPYFQQMPPKSTGREVFGEGFVDSLDMSQDNSAEIMATLNALTAESTAMAIRQWTPPAQDLLVFGGGAENDILMRNLQNALPDMAVLRGEALSGIPSQALEAMAFAWLGLQTLQGLPGNQPSVTGAHRAVPLGVLHPGTNWRQLLQRLGQT